MSKGFITIATGKEDYYRIAANLLDSYRMFSENPLPFAIVADRENKYTEKFDDVIVISNPHNSYLDKLELGFYMPYDETVFIDADCLAYGDLNTLFDYFKNADDFSCFGRVLPLADKTGWFEYENIGEYKSSVSYIVGLHGGIYYMRKTDLAERVFNDAKKLSFNYADFRFKGKFDTPGDEPLIALSMAINNCHPVPFDNKAIFCFWENVNGVKTNIIKGIAQTSPGNRTILLHWGTRYTYEKMYLREVACLRSLLNGSKKNRLRTNWIRNQYNFIIIISKLKSYGVRGVNKIKRMFAS